MKKNIGKTFKEIRLKKKLSLEYICNGICSQASLSRFENNIGDIPLNKFLKLLNRIEISESEFFSYIDQNHDLVNSNFLDNIALLYGKKDINGLSDYANKLRQEYTVSDSKIEFLYYMITVNFYNDLTNAKICSSTEIERLYNILFRTEEWDKLEIETFGNTVSLLNNDFIYSLSNELLGQVTRIARTNFPLYYNACFTLLNAFQILILRHSDLAKRLDTKLMDYKFIEVNATFNLGFYFLHSLIHLQKEDSDKLHELENMISVLKNSHCDTLACKLSNVLKTYLNEL